ncbi:hypothetical protein LTR86_008729 [Recurvomyces mirabilis]|nr:hypothetical protein LTR86_008729 [Recurvomyces mirabilis]
MPNFFYSQLFVTPEVPNVALDGQTIIVTGANVGLGFEAAKHFARMKANKVILACRDVNKGNKAASEIARSTGVPNDRLAVWQLDLSSNASVVQFAERAKGLDRLDAVVENAGIVTKQWKMAEGNESTVTVNVVNTILLGELLLPKLRESAKMTGRDGRLVFVGSEVYMWAKFQEKASDKLFAALNDQDKANMGDRYNVSKLLLLLGVRELSNRSPVSDQSPVLISILTPGFCKSTIFRDGGLTAKMMAILNVLLGRETEVGSRTLVDAACPVHSRSEHGEFLWNCKSTKPTGYVVSAEGQRMQRKFWDELSAKLDTIAPGASANVRI